MRGVVFGCSGQSELTVSGIGIGIVIGQRQPDLVILGGEQRHLRTEGRRRVPHWPTQFEVRRVSPYCSPRPPLVRVVGGPDAKALGWRR